MTPSKPNQYKGPPKVLPAKKVNKAGQWVVTVFEGSKQTENWFNTQAQAESFRSEMLAKVVASN